MDLEKFDFRSMRRDRRGATAVEYALLLGIGAAMLTIALNNLSMSIGTSMSDTAGIINNPACNIGAGASPPAAAAAATTVSAMGGGQGPAKSPGGPCP